MCRCTRRLTGARARDHQAAGCEKAVSVRVTLRPRRPDAAMSIPTPEDVRRLLTHADVRFQAFIALCAFAGLRLGEAAGVRVSDIDFLRKSLTVSRQVQRVNGGMVEIRAPKYG